MERAIEMFQKLNAKAMTLEEAMAVIPHRLEMRNDIKDLKDENNKLQKLEREMKRLVKDEHEILKKEYNEAKSNIQRTQMKMMKLLAYLDGQASTSSSSSGSVPEIVASIPLPRPLLPKELSFSDTMEVSPMIDPPTALKKKPRVCFEAKVTQEIFNKVPSYMKGRSSIIDLQDFLQIVINALNQKYHLLSQNPKNLKKADLDLYNTFKNQKFFVAEKFITDVDLTRILGKKLDKKFDRFIQMLRHCNILREARKNSLVCYVWLLDVQN